MRTLSIRRGNFHGVAYSADGRFLVSLNSRTHVRFWELGSFAERLAVKLPSYFPFFANFCLRGPRLLVGRSLWDFTPAWDYLRQPGPGRPPSPAFTRIELEGTASGAPFPILAAAADGSVVGFIRTELQLPRGVAGAVWGLDGRRRHSFPYGAWPPAGLSPAPDGRTLATTTRSKSALLLDLQTGGPIAALAHTDHPNNLLFSPDGRLLAVAAGRKVWLWDVAARQALAAFPAFQRYAEALAFSPDGRLLAAGSREGQLRLWDTAGCKELACLDWKIGAVHGLAFSPDGMTVAAAGHNNALVIWDVE
jgi:WD40 repeat protein